MEKQYSFNVARLKEAIMVSIHHPVAAQINLFYCVKACVERSTVSLLK